jgi:drug/metabolite transporter (DMT)-like permease
MLIGIAAGLAAGALWGMVFLAPLLAPNLSAVDLSAGRFLVYGTVAGLAMLLTWRSHTWPTWRQAATVLAFSLLGATGYYLLLAQGVMWAGTAVPTLIIGTIPIWVMLLGKPKGLKWAGLLPGLLLTCAGLILMMQSTLAQAARLPASGALFWWGVLLAVVAMGCWTAFALLNAAWLKRHPDVSATEWSNWMGVATGVGAMLLWLFAGSESKVLLAFDNKALIALVCIATGFGSAWIGSILWNLASRRLSVSLCGQLIVSETLFGLLYAFIWSGAWPTQLQWAAVMMFTLGIIASIRAHA